MKVRSLFYFIMLICFTFLGCKKEEINPENIAGLWYVERYTVYASDDFYYPVTYAPAENYESVGLFDFHADGTGLYTFGNQIVPFTYTCDKNTKNTGSSNSSFNGISIASGKNVNSDVIYITFDKSQVTSLLSPIIASSNIRYEVFTKTKGTLRLRSDINYTQNTTYTSSDYEEFILTRQ